MNYYPFHIGDYISHTRHLSLIEDIAYRRLIDTYYLHESPIVGEFDAIARIIGMREYVDEVTYILNTFFEFNRYGWSNKRCDDEIAKYKAKADSARNANRIKLEKKSGLKPVLKSEPDQIVTNNQKPITNNHNKTIPPPDGVDFDLWKDYLKVRNKQKKPITETAIKGLIREAEKAKLKLADVIQICAERGWVGFKAEWVDNKQAIKPNTQEWRTNDSLMMAKANELGLHTIGLQRYEIINKIDATLRSRGL